MKTRIQNLESRIQKIGGSHARGRAQGKANFVWAEVGKDGKNQAQKWEKAVQNLGFFQDNSEVSRLFLPLPGISHLFPLDFFSGAKIQQRVRRGDDAKKHEIFHAFSGEANFRREFNE